MHLGASKVKALIGRGVVLSQASYDWDTIAAAVKHKLCFIGTAVIWLFIYCNNAIDSLIKKKRNPEESFFPCGENKCSSAACQSFAAE